MFSISSNLMFTESLLRASVMLGSGGPSANKEREMGKGGRRSPSGETVSDNNSTTGLWMRKKPNSPELRGRLYLILSSQLIHLYRATKISK